MTTATMTATTPPSSAQPVVTGLDGSAAAVRAAFAEKRQSGLRAKDAAEALGLSEGAVVQAHLGTHQQPLQALALGKHWLDILQALEACGPVMALTRNESAVHEKDGVYRNLSQQGPVGLCVNPDIDLRLFFSQWAAAYAVTEPGRGDATMRSLQFFDAAGGAVHKIYARPATDLQAWAALVDRFADATVEPTPFTPAAPREALAADSSVDSEGLRAAWSGMQDTHEFFGLLKKFGCERQQSFRLTQGEFSEPLALSVATELLQRAAADATPIMVFVGSKGCIQIHSGPVHNIKPMDTASGARWINVLDEGFNLHLRNDLLRSAWLVRKPTSDGVVTSVELFDDSGEVVAMFFGVRKPGQPELSAWRTLAESLERLA